MGTMVTKFIYAQTQHISSLLRLLRLHPFGMTTPEDRANERHRRAALSALASLLAKVIAVATGLISVPLTLHYLGVERYGMWMTMSSVIAMLNFADFGIGSGMINAVSTAYGKDQESAIKEYVSSGYVVLTAIAIAIMALFAMLYSFVPWFRLFNVTTSAARQDAAPALAALVFCFALAIPLGVVQRVQMGLQRGFMASLWQCAGSLLGLAGVIAAIFFQAGLPILILAFVGSPLIASALNGIVFFGWLERRVAPSLHAVSWKAFGEVLHVGLLFFAMQIIGAILFTSDNIVIAQLLGAAAVTTYAVPLRLFATIQTVLSMALSPLWPAYGEAIARGDYAWVRRTVKRSFFAAVGITTPICVVLVFAGNWIIRKWVGPGITVPLSLLIGFGLWIVIQSGLGAVSVYLNGANIVRLQVITGSLAAILGITLKILSVPIIGISGVIWATIISFSLCVVVPTYFFIRKQFKTNESSWGERASLTCCAAHAPTIVLLEKS